MICVCVSYNTMTHHHRPYPCCICSAHPVSPIRALRMALRASPIHITKATFTYHGYHHTRLQATVQAECWIPPLAIPWPNPWRSNELAKPENFAVECSYSIFTISHSCLMSCSGRYSHLRTVSSHSSGLPIAALLADKEKEKRGERKRERER